MYESNNKLIKDTSKQLSQSIEIPVILYKNEERNTKTEYCIYSTYATRKNPKYLERFTLKRLFLSVNTPY